MHAAIWVRVGGMGGWGGEVGGVVEGGGGINERTMEYMRNNEMLAGMAWHEFTRCGAKTTHMKAALQRNSEALTCRCYV